MRNPNSHRILISGLGSIGRRHLENLEAMGIRNIAFQRSGKSTIDTPLSNYPAFTDLQEALTTFKPTSVFICGPSHKHLDVALASAKTGCHLFIEKPVAHEINRIDELGQLVESSGLIAMVGYMMRFHPLIVEAKRLVDNGRIGKLIHIRSQWGEYLPDWHPWEDYRETYAAKRTMGGGPAITLSHEIDLALFFLGGVSSVKGLINRSSDLEIDTEHAIDVLISANSGATANLHLDFYQRPPSRSTEFIGTDGRIVFDYYLSQLRIFGSKQSEHVEVVNAHENFERNNMFVDEVAHFLECVENNIQPVVSIQEGKATLEVALQAIANGSQSN